MSLLPSLLLIVIAAFGLCWLFVQIIQWFGTAAELTGDTTRDGQILARLISTHTFGVEVMPPEEPQDSDVIPATAELYALKQTLSRFADRAYRLRSLHPDLPAEVQQLLGDLDQAAQ